MPPRNKKNKNKQQNEDVYVSPKNRFNEKIDLSPDRTPTAAQEEEKHFDLQTSTNESTQQENTTSQFEQVGGVETPTRKEETTDKTEEETKEEEPKLESSQNTQTTEVLTSSIQSNWDEMHTQEKNDLTNKTLQESVVEPKDSLAESTYVHEEVVENIKKAESPVKTTVIEPEVPHVDPTNPFLTRSTVEVQEAFARAEAAAHTSSDVKTTVIEEQPAPIDPNNPFLSRSAAEVQEAFARAESPVKATTTAENIDPLQKEDTHYNPFVALSSPQKDVPVENKEAKVDVSNVLLSRGVVEVQEAFARAEAAAHTSNLENKEADKESWIVVGEKQLEKQEKAVEETIAKIDAKSKVEEPAPVAKPVALTHDERLKKAGEQIATAKSLKEEKKSEKAVNLLLSSLDLLDPGYFNDANQSVIAEVNKRIQECTLEAADCYNELMDFNQCAKYARALRKSNAESIKAIYLLGISLVRLGDLDQAHAILHEAKKINASAADNTYLNLINKELEKLDQIIERKAQEQKANTVEENYVVLQHDKVGSVHDGAEKHPKQVEKKGSGSSAAEYFLGSVVSTSAVSFVVSKYLLKYPTKKGVLTSLIVGVVVGGVSLVIQSALKKNNTDDKKKK